MSNQQGQQQGGEANGNSVPAFTKGMTIDKLMAKFGDKLNTERNKKFEQQFQAKYKEYADAQAIADGLRTELEKLFATHTESQN